LQVVLASVFALLTFVAPPSGFAAEQVQPQYLKQGQPRAAEILAPPPLPGSEEQAVDMAQVVSVVRACSSNETAIALSEKKFSAFNFSPAIGDFFVPGKFPKTEALLERVRGDADAAVGDAKEVWKRPRPYTVDPTLAGGKLETSFSYPSGHSTEATVLALTLADLFPEKREEILAIGRNIGWHRVKIARHYPTDIYAGRVFAQAIFREMKSNAAFQRDFAEAKREIAAIAVAHQPTQGAVPAEEATPVRETVTH
jgi:acid phosphatase (class A)